MKQPFISVIIPTCGRPRQLKQCLDKLNTQTYPRDRFEVIVVDDGGPEPLDKLAQSYRELLNMVLTRQKNSGAAAARNRGAAIASGAMFAFTDDDCLPEPGWLEAFAEGQSREPMSMLGGTIVNRYAQNPYAATSQLILDSAYKFYNLDPANARFFASSNIALPADCFHAVGGFSEQFRTASEDREFCDRWRWRGYRLRSVPEAIVQHSRKLSLRGFVQQHFNYGRGAFQYHRECTSRRSVSFFSEIRSYPSFLWTLVASVTRQPLRQAAPIYGLLGLWQIANTLGFLYAAVQSYGRQVICGDRVV